MRTASPSRIESIQSILGVKVDGEWGPISEAALRAAIRISMEAGKSEEPRKTGKIHPFVAVAREWMGKPETSRNRFTGDEKLWADTNYPDGWEDRAPYCAAFMCHVVAEAGRRGSRVQARPTTASVSEFRTWARSHGFMVSKPKPGDQFTLLPGGTSHIGLVESVAGDTIHTLEGNTDGAGSREGDGFWRKTRLISRCDFIRIAVA